ncbi:MAG: DEAD/DEAH box helicase [Hyphomicrobiales bacterium]|nr:DEAD/DEAH box helicase [Hyphomicrobiales bacterium]
MKFTELGLSPKVLTSVEAIGYADPTPIQQEAIPRVLERRDVLGIAQTGTGKTASFVLPMLTMLERGRARARMPRTLILEPTRELAAQVEESFNRYGANHKLNVALLIGGVSIADQLKKLDRGVDVLIATPGRLLDLFERGNLLLSGVEILVIDEADRMLDMGFIPDIERICKLLPFTRQTLFFSATMPPEIQRLADAFLSNPVRVEVSKPATAPVTVAQFLVSAGREPAEKRAVLRALLKQATDLTNAIVFCNRKRDVAILQRSLARHGFSAGALHGDMDQRSRMATLDDFRSDRITLLIASDVAARGLDIPAVSHIYNFDVPTHPEDYIHRIGRTGRAGRSGTSVTIATPLDRKYVGAIERLTGQPIDPLEIEAADEIAASRYGSRSRKSRADGDTPVKPEQTGASDGPRKPKRSNRRRSGGDESKRPAGNEDAPTHASEEAQEPAQDEPPRRPRDERPRRNRSKTKVEDNQTPFGLSEHVPQFLLRPVRPAS